MEQNTNTTSQKRTFRQIALEIKSLWKNPYFGANPYLRAMLQIDSTDPEYRYIYETAREIVTYFLANLTTWKGEDARRIKKELQEMIK